MSVIGPRPGLWNQDILTAERDKYNANDVMSKKRMSSLIYRITKCLENMVKFIRKVSDSRQTIEYTKLTGELRKYDVGKFAICR